MEIVKKQKYTPVIVLPNDTDPKELKYAAWQKLRDAGMSLREIATVMGVSKDIVANHTTGSPELTRAQLLKTAQCAREAHRAAIRARLEYYIPLMTELRNRGYNNRDIAEKTGFNPMTVYKYIGKQPDETTLASHRIAGAKVKLRNQAARNQQARNEGKPIPTVAKITEIKPA